MTNDLTINFNVEYLHPLDLNYVKCSYLNISHFLYPYQQFSTCTYKINLRYNGKINIASKKFPLHSQDSEYS